MPVMRCPVCFWRSDLVEGLDHDITCVGTPVPLRNREGDQPLPIPNDGPSMHDLVLKDILDRKALGLSRYGSLLQANNGRNMLKDAYEEILDLAVYLRGAIEEREQRNDKVD